MHRRSNAAGTFATGCQAAGYVACFWSSPIGSGLAAPLGDRMMHVDSLEYVAFSPDQTAGYPVFLNLVAGAFGDLQAAPRTQLVLLAAAIWLLGWSVQRTFRAPCFAPVLTAALLAVCAVTRFHAYVLSEALFLPLLCIMMGLLVMLAARPSVRLAAAAALACGLAIAVRPAGLGVLAVWPVLLWLVRDRCAGGPWKLAAAAAVPLTLVWAAESAVWRGVHGAPDGRPNRVNHHLFAKALMIESEPALQDGELAALADEARRAWRPRRELAMNAPDWQTRTLLARFFENGGHKIAGRRNPSFRRRIEAVAERRGTSVNLLLGEIGRTALLAAPGEWMANAWMHYRGLWLHHSIHDADLARRYAAYTDGRDVTAPTRTHDVLPSRGPLPPAIVALNRLATGAAFLASVLAAGLAVRRRLGRGGRAPDADLAAAASAAVMVHGYFLVTAVFGVTTLRYSAVMWTFEALCGLLLVRWLMRRRNRDAAGSPAVAHAG